MTQAHVSLTIIDNVPRETIMNVAELIEIFKKHDQDKEVLIAWEGQKIAIAPQDIMQEHNLVEIWADNDNYASAIKKRGKDNALRK